MYYTRSLQQSGYSSTSLSALYKRGKMKHERTQIDKFLVRWCFGVCFFHVFPQPGPAQQWIGQPLCSQGIYCVVARASLSSSYPLIMERMAVIMITANTLFTTVWCTHNHTRASSYTKHDGSSRCDGTGSVVFIVCGEDCLEKCVIL